MNGDFSVIALENYPQTLKVRDIMEVVFVSINLEQQPAEELGKTGCNWFCPVWALKVS